MGAVLNKLLLERAIRVYMQGGTGTVFPPSRAKCTATASKVVLRDRRRILAKFKADASGNLSRIR